MMDYRADDPAVNDVLRQGRVLLAFHARWCGTCRAVARTLAASEGRLGIPVVRIDVEAEPALAVRFAVFGVPQLLVLDDGVETARISGSLDETESSDWFAPLNSKR